MNCPRPNCPHQLIPDRELDGAADWCVAHGEVTHRRAPEPHEMPRSGFRRRHPRTVGEAKVRR